MNIINRLKVKRLKKFGKSVSSDQFRLTICDTNPDFLQHAVNCFSETECVEVVKGSIVHIACDAFVSPANSFGDMGGGVDKVIDDYFQGAAQQTVRQAIRGEFYGELPVGAAIVVEPVPCQRPVLICAPTMRIPGTIQQTINAYLAMRAVLVAAQKSHLLHVACPGLGTGVGGMAYDEAARQMKTAFNNIMLEEWKQILHPVQAPFLGHFK